MQHQNDAWKEEEPATTPLRGGMSFLVSQLLSEQIAPGYNIWIIDVGRSYTGLVDFVRQANIEVIGIRPTQQPATPYYRQFAKRRF